MRIFAALLLLAIASVAVSTRATSSAIVDLRGTLSLEVADTNAAQRLGLSGRESLAREHGMLFVFDRPGFYSFWMKEMRFPLDILWLRDGRIVDLVTLPPSSTHGIPSHTPFSRADRVLEMNAGVAKRLGLARGVKILLSQEF